MKKVGAPSWSPFLPYTQHSKELVFEVCFQSSTAAHLSTWFLYWVSVTAAIGMVQKANKRNSLLLHEQNDIIKNNHAK